jgi:N-acetylglucosamine kinase-like BadF-type ATPase
LGIDVGSSKTHAVIADETGACIGFGKAWAGNHQGVGYDGLESVLKESFEQAREMVGISAGKIMGAGFGVAGYDFPSDREQHLHAIASLGLSCPVEVVNDGVNGLLAGATRGIGVNVTAGSSNNCRGRGRDGRGRRHWRVRTPPGTERGLAVTKAAGLAFDGHGECRDQCATHDQTADGIKRHEFTPSEGECLILLKLVHATAVNEQRSPIDHLVTDLFCADCATWTRCSVTGTRR